MTKEENLLIEKVLFLVYNNYKALLSLYISALFIIRGIRIIPKIIKAEPVIRIEQSKG